MLGNPVRRRDRHGVHLDARRIGGSGLREEARVTDTDTDGRALALNASRRALGRPSSPASPPWGQPAVPTRGGWKPARLRGDLRATPPGPLSLLPIAASKRRGRSGRPPQHDGQGAGRSAGGGAANPAEAMAVPDRPQRSDRADATAPPDDAARGGWGASRSHRRRRGDPGPAEDAARRSRRAAGAP